MQLRAICVFIALGLSMVYLHAVIDPALMPKFMALGLLVLGLGIADLVSGEKELWTTAVWQQPIYLAYAGYWCFNLVSIIHVNVFSEWLFDVVKIALEFVFLLKLNSMLRKNPGGIVFISHSVVAFGFLICLFGGIEVLQYMNRQAGTDISSASVYNFTSTLANKNLFSSALFMVIPFGIIAFTGKSRNYLRVLATITILGAFAFIILLETRAVWVGIAMASLLTGGTLLWFFFRNRYYQGISKHLLIGTGTAAILFILLTSVTLYEHAQQNPVFKQRLTNTFLFSDFKNNPTLNTYNLRYKLWTKSWRMYKDYPITGVGAGNWEVHFPAYGVGDMEDQTTLGIEHYQRPHNDFIWVLSETGPGGLICFVALFIIAIYLVINAIRKTKDAAQLCFLYSLLFFFTGYATISFFDFPKERVEHSVLFCVALALAAGTATNTKEKKTGRTISWPIIAIPVAVLALIIAGSRANGEAHTLKVYAAQSAGSWTVMEHEAKAAQGIFYRLDPFSAPLYWYQGVAAYSENNIDEAFRDFTNAYTLHPNHVHVLNNLASCYVQKGDSSKAIALYKRAMAITPRFFESILNLSAVYFNLHQVDSAYNCIYKMPPDSTDERYRLFTTAIVKTKINSLYAASGDPAITGFIKALQTDDHRVLKLYMDARAHGIVLKTYLDSAALRPNN